LDKLLNFLNFLLNELPKNKPAEVENFCKHLVLDLIAHFAPITAVGEQRVMVRVNKK
jgi:hypothetical protein